MSNAIGTTQVLTGSLAANNDSTAAKEVKINTDGHRTQVLNEKSVATAANDYVNGEAEAKGAEVADKGKINEIINEFIKKLLLFL